MARTSRLPGFHKSTVSDRRALIADVTGTEVDQVIAAATLDEVVAARAMVRSYTHMGR